MILRPGLFWLHLVTIGGAAAACSPVDAPNSGSLSWKLEQGFRGLPLLALLPVNHFLLKKYYAKENQTHFFLFV